MERLTSQRFVPAIATARALIPEGIVERLHYDIFTGTDPVWAGLHDVEGMSFGRSYRSEMHVLYPYHQLLAARSMRAPTLIMPKPEKPAHIVHEIGHLLDAVLGFRHEATPVSWYAETSRAEAFAEAFTAWLIPGYSSTPIDEPTRRLFATPIDRATLRLFADLARTGCVTL